MAQKTYEVAASQTDTPDTEAQAFAIDFDPTQPHVAERNDRLMKAKIADLAGDIAVVETTDEHVREAAAELPPTPADYTDPEEMTSEQKAEYEDARAAAEAQLFADTEPKMYMLAAENFARDLGVLDELSTQYSSHSDTALPELVYGYAALQEYGKIDELIDENLRPHVRNGQLDVGVFGEGRTAITPPKERPAVDNEPHGEDLMHTYWLLKLAAQSGHTDSLLERAEAVKERAVEKINEHKKEQTEKGSPNRNVKIELEYSTNADIDYSDDMRKLSKREIRRAVEEFANKRIADFFGHRANAFQHLDTAKDQRPPAKFMQERGYALGADDEVLTKEGVEADYVEMFKAEGPAAIARAFERVNGIQHDSTKRVAAQRLIRSITEFSIGRQRQLLSEIA